MKISIVIPTKNEEENLPRLLESIKNQNFPRHEVEIIVVDSNSTDNTIAIAKRRGARVITENRLGIPYARDTGARSANGEIIVGTCADCVWPANHLQNIYETFKTKKKLFGLFGLIYMPDAPLAVKIGMQILGFYGHYFSKLLGYSPVCWASNFSFRKDAFKKVNGYNLDLPLLKMGVNAHASDEYNMADRLLAAGGTTLFNRRIRIESSGRRFQRRLMYWLLIEHMLGFVINEKLYHWFGFVIPVPSYSKKLSYGIRYNYALVTLVAIIFVISSYTITTSAHYSDYVVITARNEIRKTSVMKNNLYSLSQTAKKELTRVEVIRADLQSSQDTVTRQISPYIERYNPFRTNTL